MLVHFKVRYFMHVKSWRSARHEQLLEYIIKRVKAKRDLALRNIIIRRFEIFKCVSIPAELLAGSCFVAKTSRVL